MPCGARCVVLIVVQLLLAASLPAQPPGIRQSSAESAAGWVATRTVPAREAFQAAAADAQYVYAIGNTSIGKYARESGERIAVSQGEALHLNSGFFWQGRLYCAHSNYPAKPERSEIKVLDVDSMQLSTFKDFADFGGSLTWAVRHDDHWWCNFAYYGDENHRTVLVRFDDDWTELARWTYPANVIAQLGRYSLSGGIWFDNELLVTGHDDPVLFRLRLPQRGTQLEYVGCQAAPFTGQGIAVDPQTGGIVGIHRGERKIVFAARSSRTIRLRLLSYNIHHAAGIDGKLDVPRIAGVIQSVEPDIVALQEVDRGAQRTGGVDQAAELARLTGMQAVFGGNIALQGGEYGNAVLSRLPIRRHTNHRLPRFDDGEQRGVLEVEFQLPDVDMPLLLLATHLDHRRDDKERLASARRINQLLENQNDVAAVLIGDLNAVPDSAVLQQFAEKWHRANDRVAPTFPVNQPTRQIDYILYQPRASWRVVEIKVLDEAVASDHRPLLAVLDLLLDDAQ